MNLAGLLLEIVALSLLSISEVVVFIVNGLSASPNASKLGFINATAEISDEYFTEVS